MFAGEASVLGVTVFYIIYIIRINTPHGPAPSKVSHMGFGPITAPAPRTAYAAESGLTLLILNSLKKLQLVATATCSRDSPRRRAISSAT